MDEEVPRDYTSFWVSKSSFSLAQCLKGSDCTCGLFVDRNHSLLIGFSRWNMEPWRSIGIVIQTINGEPADFSSSCSTPPSDEERCSLIGAVKSSDRSHEPFKFILGNVTRN